jgi:hypothetical protein
VRSRILLRPGCPTVPSQSGFTSRCAPWKVTSTAPAPSWTWLLVTSWLRWFSNRLPAPNAHLLAQRAHGGSRRSRRRLRVGDIDFLRRRIELHRNAVQVGRRVVVGTLKSNENRTVSCLGSSSMRWPKQPSASAAKTSCGRQHQAVHGAACLQGFLAIRCGCTMPKVRSHISPSHGSRTAAHGGLAGDQRGGESEGGAADVGARQRRDDAGCLRRFVRLRSLICCRKCGQNVGTRVAAARPFDAKRASTSTDRH